VSTPWAAPVQCPVHLLREARQNAVFQFPRFVDHRFLKGQPSDNNL